MTVYITDEDRKLALRAYRNVRQFGSMPATAMQHVRDTLACVAAENLFHGREHAARRDSGAYMAASEYLVTITSRMWGNGYWAHGDYRGIKLPTFMQCFGCGETLPPLADNVPAHECSGGGR